MFIVFVSSVSALSVGAVPGHTLMNCDVLNPSTSARHFYLAGVTGCDDTLYPGL